MRTTSFAALVFLCFVLATSLSAQSENQQYQPLTLDFEIEVTEETAAANPFLDYRLQVEFKMGEGRISVPGFYAADGNAAETGASSGGVWRVIFSPDSPGDWQYAVSFRKGKNIAIDDDAYTGEPIAPHHGKTGTIQVGAVAGNAKGFSKSGRLKYAGKRYLYTQDGNPLLKFGANSPENFLAYEDIDGSYSYDKTKSFLKSWEPHLKDWKNGDPSWKNGKGKGIIGALNYLASKGMNSVYALTLNIEGDARDVWPFLSHERKDFKRYDVSKLAQWDIVFSHAEKLGIIMQLVTQEKENELILDDGNTGMERKLYYRELVARFGYHNNIIWNMGEENGSAPFWPQGQNDQQRFAMIRYLKDHDPYRNPIVIHTMPDEHERNPVLDKLLRFDRLDGLSMQISDIKKIHHDINEWVTKSENAERPWIITMDEIGPWHTGTKPDEDDPTHDKLRKEVLWGTLMAGGAGVEWYFGWLKPPHDLNAEDWRSRNNIWEQTAVAHKFFKSLPYVDMKSSDQILENRDNFCFAKEGELYVVYLKNGGVEVLDLADQLGTFRIEWYDPRKGGKLQQGSISSVKGGSKVNLGIPPSDALADWVVKLSKVK